ncbi:transposase [Microbacterium sp. STF-2]|uniref:RNA-guided endonuclease InsQ/TnpB family protein n=1 Tax=Microbacterium sp. STF-2 TaxID=3031132 RepID=UPI002B0003B7|nr:transposase [Microbacterium sp. STF-2]MEA1263848.1 transposase [Microbacterium sp. STF-2]
MPESAHGTPSGYTFWNCRCRQCNKVARTSSKTRARGQRVKRDLEQMPPEEHGTTRGYNKWSCRCAPCREAGAIRRAEVKAERRAESEGAVQIKRFSYRIYPEPNTVSDLRRVFGSCRFVYNSYIALARERYATGAKHPSSYDAAKTLVTEARRNPDNAWLAEVSYTALAAAVHDAADAYQRYFDSAAGRIKGRRVGHPKFKTLRTARKSARFAEDSFTIRGGWQNTGQGGGRLHLANINQDIQVNWHRPLPGYPSAVTVREDPDGAFRVSFVVRVPVASSKQPTRASRAAGIDVGLNDYAAIAYSDGKREKIANPRHYRQAEDRLRRTDKNLSRKTPGSNNYAKAKRARARAHRRVANLRENHARQLASKLSRENQTVVIETLNIAGMARTNMAKSINDAGWGQLLRFLEEACTRKGVGLLRAPRFFASTQICSACGENGGKKPLNVRSWTCVCGVTLDRDYNAATNILAAGPAVYACGRDVRLRLAGAVSDEAGSHRSEGLPRRRKRALRGRVQASSDPRKLKGFRGLVENRGS